MTPPVPMEMNRSAACAPPAPGAVARPPHTGNAPSP